MAEFTPDGDSQENPVFGCKLRKRFSNYEPQVTERNLHGRIYTEDKFFLLSVWS